MPMYDFKCQSCGYRFDKLISFSASEKSIECPKCRKQDSKKLLCAPNITNSLKRSPSQNNCNSISGFS